MVKTRDLEKIKLHRDAWKPLKPNRREVQVIGWDTETKPNGDTFLLTKSDINGDYAFKVDSFEDFLDIIWNQETRSAINFFYNMGFDIGSIAKFMGERPLRDLCNTGVCLYDKYLIKYIPNKSLTLGIKDSTKFKKGSVKFFDALQFYKTTLKKAAELVGETKIDFETNKIDYNLFLSNKRYHDDLIEYAKVDARICRKLGQRLFDACNKIIPVYHFYSTASIAQQYFLSQLDYQLKLPLKKILELSLNSYGGGRFELIRRGHFDHVYEIDINSAYPKEMSLLAATETETGRWDSLGPNDTWNPDALYGFYEITTKTHGYLLSPIMHKMKEVLTYPHGEHTTFVEQSEMKVIDKLGFKINIIRGYEYFDTNPIYPFKFINALYKTRIKLKNEGKDDLQYVYKIIMNSAYGKTIQMMNNTTILNDIEIKNGKQIIDDMDIELIEGEDGELLNIVKDGFAAGRMFNPVFASAITARTRSRLLDTTLKYGLEKNLIGFATDCLFLKEKPPLSLVENNDFGDWKLEVNDAEGLFIGSGVYALRKQDKQINHIRGFKSKRDLFHDIYENYILTPEEQGILFENISPVKMKEGIRGGRRQTPNGEIIVGWKDIGKFIQTRKVLDLNFDKKRKWEWDVKSPQDLMENEIESEPLVI